MAAKRVSILIGRRVEDVFAYMNDVAREREWQPGLREAEQRPTGPAAVGSTRRYVSEFMGRRIENTYVIRVYEANRHVALETTPDSALTGTSDIRWEAVGEGTKVVMSVEGSPRGALKLVPGRVLAATFERELTAALRRLKELLERGA